MAHTTHDALCWVSFGTELLVLQVKGADDEAVQADSTLPGWSVGQLIAHVAANADALTNLVSWASTGVEAAMYASVEARDSAIVAARELSAAELLDELDRSAATLDAGLAGLSEDSWRNAVRTIQGRVLPASEIPWLRAREVCVHAVDLGASFSDLPDDFLDALIDDICAKRALPRASLPQGPKPEIAAWLAGRPHTLSHAPEIGAWL